MVQGSGTGHKPECRRFSLSTRKHLGSAMSTGYPKRLQGLLLGGHPELPGRVLGTLLCASLLEMMLDQGTQRSLLASAILCNSVI